tara:strand:- start:89 stop:370 length:282 start_codon:yes stop_codon:yes gene_type:complete
MKNSKLLIVLLSVLLVSLSIDAAERTVGKVNNITTEDGVKCISVVHHWGIGVSCNWEEYNDKVKVCKKASLKRRTMKDGVIFPAMKGECKKAN